MNFSTARKKLSYMDQIIQLGPDIFYESMYELSENNREILWETYYFYVLNRREDSRYDIIEEFNMDSYRDLQDPYLFIKLFSEKIRSVGTSLTLFYKGNTLLSLDLASDSENFRQMIHDALNLNLKYFIDKWIDSDLSGDNEINMTVKDDLYVDLLDGSYILFDWTIESTFYETSFTRRLNKFPMLSPRWEAHTAFKEKFMDKLSAKGKEKLILGIYNSFPEIEFIKQGS